MKIIKIMMMALMMCFTSFTFSQKRDVLVTVGEEQIILPLSDGKVFYQETFIVDSTISLDEMYSNIKLFVAKNYKSSNDVIQLDDKLSGVLLIKGVYNLSTGDTRVLIYHTMKLQFKSGKAKIEISNFTCDLYSPASQSSRAFETKSSLEELHNYIARGLQQGWKKKFIINIYKEIDDISVKMIQTFKEEVSKKNTSDW